MMTRSKEGLSIALSLTYQKPNDKKNRTVPIKVLSPSLGSFSVPYLPTWTGLVPWDVLPPPHLLCLSLSPVIRSLPGVEWLPLASVITNSKGTRLFFFFPVL